MAQDSPDNADASAAAPKKDGQKVYLWSRSTQGHVGEGAPGSETTTTTAAGAGAAPITPEQQQPKKLDPTKFQANFPPQEGGAQQGYPSITEAVKSIKSDDFLNVVQTPCARDGFLTGIASGAGVGGLRYVMRGESPRPLPLRLVSSYPLAFNRRSNEFFLNHGDGHLDSFNLPTTRFTHQGGKLGRRKFPHRLHWTIRVLPVPPAPGAPQDEEDG